jgi:hypothetical protein
MLLDSLKNEIIEMIDLAPRIENYDATVAASQTFGKPIATDGNLFAQSRMC